MCLKFEVIFYYYYLWFILQGSFNDNSLKSQNKQKPQTLPDKPPETSLLTQTEKKFIVLLLSDINIQEVGSNDLLICNFVGVLVEYVWVLFIE